jgi:hypothetical protein
MRSVHTAVPLVLAMSLMACQPSDDPATANDPLSPSAPGIRPSFGAAVFHSPVDFFFLNDFDRDYSATIGLVSPVADLNENPDCGGAGPRIVDTGLENVVLTPAGSIHVRDRWQKATFVLYGGATDDVCELSELATHPVVAQGEVNFSFGVRVPDVTEAGINFHFQMTGIVDLTSGGKAHVLISANFLFDNDGNLTVHVDKFELKPIGG